MTDLKQTFDQDKKARSKDYPTTYPTAVGDKIVIKTLSDIERFSYISVGIYNNIEKRNIFSNEDHSLTWEDILKILSDRVLSSDDINHRVKFLNPLVFMLSYFILKPFIENKTVKKINLGMKEKEIGDIDLEFKKRLNEYSSDKFLRKIINSLEGTSYKYDMKSISKPDILRYCRLWYKIL